jgi:flagellar motility protein MotE (MotC chaperone)
VTGLRNHLRLLPAVAALSLVVLAMKASGLALDAHAASGSQLALPAGPSESEAKNTDPAADEAETTSADVDVLTSLARRRAELDARQRQLQMRENLLAAAEKRVDDKIAQLKGLQGQIQTLLGMRDDAAQKQLTALVKTYSSMKPRDAGRIFDDLDEDVMLNVASQMKPDVLGAILAQMKSEAAEKLTVRLAERLKATEVKAAPPAPAAQMAAATLPQNAAIPAPASAPAPAPTTSPPASAAAPSSPSPAPAAPAAAPPATPNATPPAGLNTGK